jgi:hypothetical protein
MAAATSPAGTAPGSSERNSAATDSGSGVIADVMQTIGAARETLSGLLELFALETHRAAVAVVWMVALAFVSVMFIVTAWIGLMVALGIWIVSMGLPTISTIIAIASINLAVAAALLYTSIGMVHRLLFPATRRQIAGRSSVASSPT